MLAFQSGCQSLRNQERFVIRHHSGLTEALGLGLRPPPSDSSFRYCYYKVDLAALCAAIRDWTIAQFSGGPADLDQWCVTARACGAQSSPQLVVARRSLPRSRCNQPLLAWRTTTQMPVSYSQACYASTANHERAVLRELQEQGGDVLLTMKPQASPKE